MKPDSQKVNPDEWEQVFKSLRDTESVQDETRAKRVFAETEARLRSGEIVPDYPGLDEVLKHNAKQSRKRQSWELFARGKRAYERRILAAAAVLVVCIAGVIILLENSSSAVWTPWSKPMPGEITHSHGSGFVVRRDGADLPADTKQILEGDVLAGRDPGARLVFNCGGARVTLSYPSIVTASRLDCHSDLAHLRLSIGDIIIDSRSKDPGGLRLITDVATYRLVGTQLRLRVSDRGRETLIVTKGEVEVSGKRGELIRVRVGQALEYRGGKFEEIRPLNATELQNTLGILSLAIDPEETPGQWMERRIKAHYENIGTITIRKGHSSRQVRGVIFSRQGRFYIHAEGVGLRLLDPGNVYTIDYD